MNLWIEAYKNGREHRDLNGVELLRQRKQWAQQMADLATSGRQHRRALYLLAQYEARVAKAEQEELKHEDL